jgi:hypothetical protein
MHDSGIVSCNSCVCSCTLHAAARSAVDGLNRPYIRAAVIQLLSYDIRCHDRGHLADLAAQTTAHSPLSCIYFAGAKSCGE